MRRILIPLLTLVAFSACRKIEPVPEDLDELMHFVWQEIDEGSDEILAEAVNNLHKALDGNHFDELIEGEVSDLGENEVAFVGRSVDPSTATGMFIADRIGCTIPELNAVVAYEHQDELYTGIYDSYDRVSTSSVQDYLDRRTDTVTWDIVYSTSMLGTGYTVESRTLMRRVRDLQTRSGAAVLIRANLLGPAVFDNPDSNGFLEQDYHLEVYWPHNGGLLHAYALWKDTRLLGFEDEEEATQRVTLNNLADWDEDTTQLCEEGRP